MSTPTQTRVGVVGAGFGRYTLVPAFRRDPRCEVVAICTTSEASATEAARELGIAQSYSDVASMLDSGLIDAIAVATPPREQPEILQDALKRSLPVFAEKLLAVSVDDARALHRAAKAAGVANVVDYIFPELEVWRRARRLIREGFIGPARHMTVSWMLESHDNRLGLATWKTEPTSGGGALRHFAPHVFYYVEWLMGPIGRLGATLARATDSERPGDTFLDLGLRFVSGTSGSISMSTTAPFGSGHRVEIYGKEGAITLVNDSIDPVHGFTLVAVNKRGQRVSDDEAGDPVERLPGLDSRVEPVSRLASRFLDWIQNNDPTVPSFREGLRVQVLVDAADRSHATRRQVDVAPS